jgi:hypothetical protein
MELLGDVGHVESHFFTFGYSVSVSAGLVHDLCLMVLLGGEAQAKTHFCPFGVLMLTQDRCTVCVEHTIGSHIVLDATDGTPR